MKNFRNLLALAAGTLTVALATPAAAQEQRNSQTTITTERGEARVQRSTTRADDGRTGSAAITGPDGQTASREYSSSFDRGQGVSRTSIVTGPQGRQRTVYRSAQRVARGEVARERQVQGPRGTTRPAREWVRVRRPR